MILLEKNFNHLGKINNLKKEYNISMCKVIEKTDLCMILKKS